MPRSYDITVDPVNTAISFKMALRLSPKDGALIAHTWIPACNLLTIKFVNGSLSTSSAIIIIGLFFYMACSKYFRICLKEVILCSERRIKGF